jgi:two-component system, NtrC family, nitrogen regulation sensor histidine kinase NtrY
MLRTRILAGFLFAAVVPLLAFGVLVTLLVSRRFDETAKRRLDLGVQAAERRLADMRREAGEAVRKIAQADLAETPVPIDPGLADRLAERHGLQLLEIVDAEGRVLLSHHWPAGLGLPARRKPLGEGFHKETVGAGYGAEESLGLTATAVSAARPEGVLTVRGGYLIDAARLRDLADLLGLEVGVFEAARSRWTVPPQSPLSEWPSPPVDNEVQGEVALPSGQLRYAAKSLAPGVTLMVATPAAPLLAVRRSVFSLTAFLALVSALAALVAGVVLSGRLARPLRVLADRARTLGRGDFETAFEVREAGEVGELARAFDTMTAELREARERTVQAERVAAWREMARRLAHELKNPIFPIQLSIETLRRALDQETASGPAPGRPRFEVLFREASDTILDELRALRKIVDEFSEFARMPRPHMAPVDVNRVVQQVLALYDARASGLARQTVLDPDLPEVTGDPDLLARALGNLVANAIEAMTEGGTLSVRTQAVPGGVRIQVADTGPGLTEDQRTRLFTPHYTTKQGGTGLGLAIVQGIVSDHGGRAEAVSAPGEGTTFTLFLPLVRPSEPTVEDR